MNYIKKIILVSIVFSLLLACSTKKNTLIRRNYHALTTKFNVLFNGNEAFNNGIEAINNGYKDDFFKQLPIEPIAFEEDRIILPKNSNITNLGDGFDSLDTKNDEEEEIIGPFDIAEEKAVKAIQKHSMNFNGFEKNKQIDDAYLLLGKSRYYSQRFIPALEAFNYIIASYPNANLIAETKIWRAKTNIRLDNEELAIESLNLLLQKKDSFTSNLPDVIKEQGHTAMAMAYVKTDSLQQVKKHLHLATKTQENKDQAARNLFILGQIYASENQKDSAILVFKKLRNFKKAPYRFKIHSSIEIAKNTTSDSSALALINEMQELIKNRDNRPYLDELYYQVGNLYENIDSTKTAITYYNKSTTTKKGSNQQKTYTFEKLGNLYFKNTNYMLASAYYDSVLNISSDSLNVRIRSIKRKHKNLASLIKFENIVTNNDSILKIASLSKTEQEVFFKNYIETLKKKDEEAAQLQLNQAAFGDSFGSSSLQSKKGNWYFYNNQSIAFGKTEFQKTWGSRKLEDNWRWASKIKNNANSANETEKIEQTSRYDLASYLKSIPTKITILDSLKTQRNQALFELGLIYKEQFNNSNLAIERLKRVADLQPKKELILPIKWHLYQIYSDLEKEQAEADRYKNAILTEHPNSIFAKIITSPDKQISQDVAVDEVANLYKECFYLYKKNKFTETVSKIEELLPTIQNSVLLSKFELLKAYAIGKYANKETYKKALETVVVNYTNTPEGKKAQDIVKQLNK